ncbi:PREDICTED: ankyrin-3-like isoform X2 [Ceratosolen solmsi marchali]|uniref:Ankyrin-3-like isoform X2 n=1 Tax=Ceratosolen solmsi marchali TaxID=326594 RepID=A0AAJ7DWW3_9HYME|nr:PREDICTED: ankyrin-3-like isoform X2 [Ceratosolen solmsi marchali]
MEYHLLISGESMLIKFYSNSFRRLTRAVHQGNIDLASSIFDLVIFSPANIASILRIAVSKCDVDMVKLILYHKPNLNLHVLMDIIWTAVYLNSKSIVMMLINYGLNAHHFVGLYNSNLLHAAVERGKESEVVLLLNHGVDVNTRGVAGASALQYAIQLKQINIVHRLLKNGARIDMLNNEHNSVLHTAANTGNLELVSLMLSNGADAKVTNYKKKGTLHFAAEAEYENVSVAELLLRNGAALDGVDEMHFTPLHFALMTRKKNMIQFFMEQGANLNAKTKSSIFPLYLAIEYTTASIIELLLKKGARVNEKTSQGLTALHIACKNGSKRKIDVLLNYGADINSKSEVVSTPLYWLDIRSKLAKNTIAKHVAELKFQNLFIREENLSIIQVYSDWQMLYKKYLCELERMTTKKVYNNISFYHVLSKTSNKLLPLLRNNDFVSAFQSTNLPELFPLYEKELNKKFAKARKKKKQLDLMRTRLKSIFSQHLPEIALERILLYYSEETNK